MEYVPDYSPAHKQINISLGWKHVIENKAIEDIILEEDANIFKAMMAAVDSTIVETTQIVEVVRASNIVHSYRFIDLD